MRKIPNVVLVVAVIFGLVVLAISLGWFGSGKAPAANGPPQTETTNPVPDPTPKPVNSQSSTSVTKVDRKGPSNPSQPKASPNQLAGTPAPDNLITNWEDKLDEILTADNEEEADKAKKLLAMFPRLPAEGQTEVAQHLSNLVSDENYAALEKYLADPRMPEDVLDTLMADVLNRPNSLKLPALLDVAKDPNHPKASEAKDLLELFLEEDYGTNWSLWQTKMEEWLKANPD